MRIFSKIIIVVLLGLCFTAALGFYWLNYDSHDLPDISALAQFAPSQPGTARIVCGGAQVDVVPYSAMGGNVLAALEAAEAGTNNPKAENPRPTLMLQIARTIYCDPDRELRRGVLEMRTAIQLQRHYSQNDLKAIYLNTRSFGDNIYGVNGASQHFFHKAPGDLQIAEAALLAGLIKAPNHDSPTQHPDRALTRRNEVIDAMAAAGKISSEDAAAAKNSPLLPVAPAQ